MECVDRQEMARAVADELLKREALATLLAAVILLAAWWLVTRGARRG